MVFKSNVPYVKTKILSRAIEGSDVRVAVFQSGYYNKSLAHTLKNEGFFAMSIKDPTLADIYEYPDFVLAPEWIRWLMPTPTTPKEWANSLQSSHHRNVLKSRLKTIQIQDDEIRIEIKPLTLDDYRIWHERLYLPIIGGKTGAVLFWPNAEALSKKLKVTPSGDVVNFLRIFIYHRNGSLVGGSLWSVYQSQRSLTVRAAAFEQKALAKYKLSIRVMEESIIYANAHQLRWTSHGSDPNFYGVDVTIGLQSYKASIGMNPILCKIGSFQLVKILDENLSQIRSANGEDPSVLIFTIGGNDVSDRAIGYQRQPPQVQRGNLDLVWSRRHDLKPIRFVAQPQTPAISVPEGMILQDIVLTLYPKPLPQGGNGGNTWKLEPSLS
ncbi:MAG: hypothetical protein Q8K00_11955 [Syntrophales bacterium]|nr:hypothetical protein [Syntrophales bacterium]